MDQRQPLSLSTEKLDELGLLKQIHMSEPKLSTYFSWAEYKIDRIDGSKAGPWHIWKSY